MFERTCCGSDFSDHQIYLIGDVNFGPIGHKSPVNMKSMSDDRNWTNLKRIEHFLRVCHIMARPGNLTLEFVLLPVL